MKRTLYLLLLLASFFFGSCTNRAIYTSPAFHAKTKDHKTLAIIPFETIINLRPNQMERLGPKRHKEMEQKEALAVQNALYSFFLKEKGKENFAIDVQDIHKTNTLLYRHNITQEDIKSYTYEELAEILGVDAIISGTLQTDKPLSDGAALAMGLLLDTYALPTNSGAASIAINDGQTGELLWRYQKSLDRGLGSDTYTIISAIIRKASKKLPYEEREG
ncbi:hypothetical protein ACFSRY_09265 [Pontibacter locisalis]|uniref:Lipoprotein n=1 Tax=Pontibacter locisalis TaxID=1719035 RepID=A0ABW5IM39_9BACT